MKLSKIGVLVAILILPVCTQATPIDVNIYTDTTIGNGEEYGTVNIYDTPPDQTIVTMTGGNISYGNVYDTAILNCYGGELSFPRIYNDAKATIYSIDYIASVELHENGQLHIYDGGSALSVSVQIFDDAELHVYGYNLVYDEIPHPNWVTGKWANGQNFTIYLRNIYTYNPEQVFLHEIPEPSTLSILGLFSLFLRKRGN